MLHKTRGIVLHQTNYNDKYAIVRVFTEEFGTVSYLAPKNKGRKTKTPRSFFYPLAVLEMEVEHYNLRDIHLIKEVKPHLMQASLLSNPVKSTICIFLSEFLGKVIREVQAEKLLFAYLLHSLEVLDLSERDYANFHLVFMTRLSQFLGFYPDVNSYERGMLFDMQNGTFALFAPNHAHFLDREESEAFSKLLRMNYENMRLFRFSRKDRHRIIQRILEYYQLHLSNFGEVKSLEVLQELFNR